MIRSASGRLFAGIAAFAALSMAPGAKVHADDYRRLSRVEIKRLIAVEGVFMNKRSTGAWRVKGAKLCITRGSEEESCVRVPSSSAGNQAFRVSGTLS